MSVYNGTFVNFANGGPASPAVWMAQTASGFTGSQSTGTVTFYPGLTPLAAFFNDSTGGVGNNGQRCLAVDFFGFAWNPALKTGGSTPNPVKPRYF